MKRGLDVCSFEDSYDAGPEGRRRCDCERPATHWLIFTPLTARQPRLRPACDECREHVRRFSEKLVEGELTRAEAEVFEVHEL